MGWIVTIGQGGSIRTQDRVVDVRVTEEFAHKSFMVTVQKPTQAERDQAKGRINNAIIQIKRGSDIYVEGFIEDVELGQDIVKYSGRSFLVLLGYTTSSKASGAGDYEAEYDDDDGATIINDLINTFCLPHDAEITYTDITFTETYGGEVKLHGQKVYDIVRNMCIDYSKDLWSDATWNGDGINIDNKNIHVGTKSRGNAGAPHKTLYGGQHLKNIPTVKYRSSQNVINRIRVNGKGDGKEKVSVIVDDGASQATYGVIEGSPYNNNMIVDETTATAVGQAIIDAKKDLVEEVHLDLIIYIPDLKYGDWVRVLDSYSGVDTTQRIKKITRSYNTQQGESVEIEIGMPFDNYEMLIKDLTKGDVDSEPEMTKLGGSFQLTANDPPGDWIRYDKGVWYDTIGVFQEKIGKGVVPFWTYADNPATGQYKKALIQISNAGAVSYKVGTQQTSTGAAEATTVSADALNTPLGEVILKGKAVGGGGYTVEDVYSDDQGKSYIFRDVRPIIGSSATGFGGDVSNPMTADLAAGGFKITGLGVAVAFGDAISLDADGYVPIANLPLGGTGLKGGLLVGKETGCESLLPPAEDGYVLTIDSLEDFGVKWAAVSAGLWEVDGTETQLITPDDIDMQDFNIIGIGDMKPYNPAGIDIVNTDEITRIFLGLTDYSFKAQAPGDMSGNNLIMGSGKITGLAAGTTNGDSLRYEQLIGSYLLLAGGTMAGNIDMNDNNIIGIGDMKSQNPAGIDIENSAGVTRIFLGLTSYSFKAQAPGDMSGNNLEMDGGDIIDVDEIKGTTSNPLELDFRGDANHKIYYNGTVDNQLQYDTYVEHLFTVQDTMIASMKAAGLIMNTGKYIKSFSGDLELRAPSGSKVKFVIG